MDYRIIDYKDASVQMASFEGKEGCGEYHLLARVLPEGSFQQQLKMLQNYLAKQTELSFLVDLVTAVLKGKSKQFVLHVSRTFHSSVFA